MAHLDFVRPSGQYPGESVPGASDWQRFDVAQAKTVNGDLGGSWSPTGPIIVGGQGITSSVAGTQFTGGVLTTTGGRIVLGGNDFVGTSPVRTALRSCRLCDAKIANGLTSFLDDSIAFSLPPAPFGVQTSSALLYVDIPSRRLFEGVTSLAYITSVTIGFRVVTNPAATPTPLSFIFQGINAAGTLQQPTPASLPSPWTNTTGYIAGNYATGNGTTTTGVDASRFYFKCTTPGTSGGSPPTWNATIGATTNDNTVVWTCMGRNGTLAASVTPAVYYNGGASQTIGWDYDTSTQDKLDFTQYRYQLRIANPNDASSSDPTKNLILNSATFGFSGQTRAGWS